MNFISLVDISLYTIIFNPFASNFYIIFIAGANFLSITKSYGFMIVAYDFSKLVKPSLHQLIIKKIIIISSSSNLNTHFYCIPYIWSKLQCSFDSFTFVYSTRTPYILQIILHFIFGHFYVICKDYSTFIQSLVFS